MIPDSGDGVDRILARFASGAPRPRLDCGPGWFPLLADLDADLARVDNDYTVVQVKEKFAKLKFYFHTDKGRDVREKMAKRVKEAYELSARTCELCGQPGERQVSSVLLKTLCPQCVESENATGLENYVPAPPDWKPDWARG